MSDMNGNPHYADYQLDLDNASDYDASTMQLHATLALAYEQRTANLIALMAMSPIDMTDWPQPAITNFLGQSDNIMFRLGLNEGAIK